MLTGKNLLNEFVDELNELKLSHMAAKLDSLYPVSYTHLRAHET